MLKEYSKEIAKEIQKQMMTFEIKAVAKNGTFKVIASDESVDRAGEVIKVSWRDFENYMKNPIMLFGHDYRNIASVAWKATKVYIEDNKLIVEGVFAWTEQAQILRQLYDEGIIKTVSVWFIPRERDNDNRTVITKAELLEVSFVPVPANPNALSIQKAMLDKAIEFGIVKEEEKEEVIEEEKKPEEVIEENKEEEIPKIEEAEEKEATIKDVMSEIKSLKESIVELTSTIKTKEIEKPEADGEDISEDDQKSKEIEIAKAVAKKWLQNLSKIVSTALHDLKI